MKQCTKCERYLPISRFGVKSWINKNGSKTTRPKSHCRDCINKDNLKRYHTNPSTREAHKTASYKSRIKSYGLTLEEYENKLASQENKCATCGEDTKQLVIDHCHTTGKVRDLLCGSCNTALGHSKESIVILENLIEYIKRHNE